MNYLTSLLQRLLKLPRRLQLLLALCAGALVPLSFAPFHLWPLGLFALIILCLQLNQQPLKEVMWRTGFFAMGMYAMGVSWIYVSISGFGGAPPVLAIALVAVFVIFMALLFVIPFYIFGRWFSAYPHNMFWAFPATWLLSEWLRTWLFTGFPWLYIGYGDLHNWLSGWAPVLGVLGLGFITALTAGFVADALLTPQKKSLLFFKAFFIASCWLSGFCLQKVEWTTVEARPTKIAIVQPNIKQEEKWQTENRESTMNLLREKSEPLWDNKIIIWPEAAVTQLYSEALPFLNEMNRKAADHHAGLITGIIYDDIYKDAYFNSVVAFGDAIGMYHKRRLVPFGEYVPMEWLRNVISFFNLPTSIISLGPDDQHGIKIDNILISPSICYELAYPDLVARSAIDSQLLLSVSNLGWFGDSLGYHQFMEMAQMRALETQRFYAYSTNNGPSAIFDRKGNIIATTNAFEQSTLVSEFYAVNGNTPFMLWGSLPLVLLNAIGLLLLFFKNRFWKT